MLLLKRGSSVPCEEGPGKKTQGKLSKNQDSCFLLLIGSSVVKF